MLHTPQGLAQAVHAAIEQSFEKKALIETFAEGQEYSVEHISWQGKHHFLAMTLKYTTDAPHFIETGHLEPAPVSPQMLERVKRVVDHALDTLGIEYGASHTELKIDAQGNILLIEIGGRMGGDCIGSDLVRYSTGYDFVKMVIDVACGRQPDFTKVCTPQAAKVQFIMNQHDLEVFEALRREHPEQILQLTDLHPENLGHTTDSSNRAGCYIVRAEQPQI